MRKSRVLRWIACCLLACHFLACGSDYYVAPGWHLAPQAKSVLVVPANFDLTPLSEILLGAQMATDEICARFRASGRSVQLASLREVFEIWEVASKTFSDLENQDQNLKRAVVAGVLAQKYGVDLVIMPTVVIRDATVRGRSFRWDGVSQDYISGELGRGYLSVGFDGEGAVSSLRIVAFDRRGRRVLEAYGGLESLAYITLEGDRYRYGKRQDLFEDPRIVANAVTIARRGFLPPLESRSDVSIAKVRAGWRRYESGSLSMVSDAREAVARRIFEETLRFIEAAKTLLGQEHRELSSVRIILFGTDQEYRRFASGFASDLVDGYTIPNINGTEVVLSAELHRKSLVVLYHELIHVILFQHDALVYPLWYHEGLADFMSSALVRGDIATVGAVPGDRVSTIRAHEALPLSKILSRRSFLNLPDDEALRYYADAWAFVYFLHRAERRDGDAYWKGMIDFIANLGQGEDWREVLEESFGMSLDKLGSAYQQYRGRLGSDKAPRARHIPIPDRDYSHTTTLLSDSEAKTRLGEHALAIGESALELAESYFEKALELDPTNVRAEVGMGSMWTLRGRFQQALQILSDLPIEGEHAGRVYEARGVVALPSAESMSPGEQETAARGFVQTARADFALSVELDPDRASAWFHLGSTYAIDPASSTQLGIDAFSQAARLSPGSPAIKLGLGFLHARAGHRAVALRHLRSVLASHDENQALQAQRIIESAGLIDFE